MKKQLPLETIEKWLKDNDWHVRQAAMNWYKAAGLPIPLVRTIEPPDKVYKKCVGGVIVIAEVPDDAQVRGSVGSKCRTNKAKIVDIIGTLGGEPVGISTYDKRTAYFIGDDVEIDDFDYSDEKCSQGYHFFCTLQEAKDYRS